MREVRIHARTRRQSQRRRGTVNTESHQIIEEFMLAANEAVRAAMRIARIGRSCAVSTASPIRGG